MTLTYRAERRAQRRAWRFRTVLLPAIADPYTYGLTPGEKRELNARAMAVMEGQPFTWYVPMHCRLCGRWLPRRAVGGMRGCPDCRVPCPALSDHDPRPTLEVTYP